jgi:uncharacterized protein (TIGR02246 family)
MPKEKVMKHLVPVFLVVALWSADCAAQSEADEESILETFHSWNRGWADADADMAVRDYAENADWTNAFGDRFQGKDALRNGLAYIFSLGFVMAGDSASNEYNDVTFLSSDVAMVRSHLVRTGQQTSTGDAMPDRHINHLRVYQKRDGQWLIVSHLISQAKEKR